MENYIQILFAELLLEKKEILIALLSNIGFDGFEEEESSLKAFIQNSRFNEAALLEISSQFQVPFSIEEVATINWNQQWESNFKPICVENFVAIRANFHEVFQQTAYDIIITPKMSFGTGHHATTYMMVKQMKEIDFQNKAVLDFGTGTGILAILAEKLGANEIFAIDIDDWSITNAQENIIENKCSNIKLIQTSSPKCAQKFDVILANINKQVILDNLNLLALQLNENGIIVLSGLLEEDETALTKLLTEINFAIRKRIAKSNWISLIVGNE